MLFLVRGGDTLCRSRKSTNYLIGLHLFNDLTIYFDLYSVCFEMLRI